jgi:Ca2+-binding RTX toxin-like protein
MVAEECDPRYSADGLKIAYGTSSQTVDIWDMNADGSGQRDLTNTALPVAELDPTYEAIESCKKSRATIVGDDGPDVLKGTKRRDVIVANGGNDLVKGKGGNDLICLGAGKDKAIGGKGTKDKCIGGPGKDTAKGCEKGKL